MVFVVVIAASIIMLDWSFQLKYLFYKTANWYEFALKILVYVLELLQTCPYFIEKY